MTPRLIDLKRPRHCRACGAELCRRDDEPPSAFRSRKTCNKGCADTYKRGVANHMAQLRARRAESRPTAFSIQEFLCSFPAPSRDLVRDDA